MSKETIKMFCILIWGYTFIPGLFIEHKGDVKGDIKLSTIGAFLKMIGSISLFVAVLMNF